MTHDLECFEGVIRDFKEVQKQVRSRENEEEIKAQHAENQTGEKFLERKGGPSIRDVSMRPSMGSARSRPVWNLEAHANGFRCSVRGSATEKLEVLYSQIKVAIFQPCEKRSLLVLIHFHLNEPIMVNRRKTARLHTPTGPTFRTFLGLRRSANAYDPDEIIQEQREEEMKERLNKVFRDFVQKDLSISGVYHRANSPIFLCSKSIISVQEWPPLVVHMDDVELFVFERVTLATREFDMVMVRKDYSEHPTQITMIPSSKMIDLKSWLGDLKMTLGRRGCMNMQWKAVMQEVTGDLKKFIDFGGWQHWFDDGGSEDDAAQEPCESDFEADDSEVDEDDNDGDDLDEEFSEDEDDDDSDDDDDDDDDSAFDEEDCILHAEGKDWDELEAEAEEEERKKRRGASICKQIRGSQSSGSAGGGAGQQKPKTAPKPKARNTKRTFSNRSHVRARAAGHGQLTVDPSDFPGDS
eukprot:g27417.t1